MAEDRNKPKKAIVRSPNYPTFSLGEAIERIRTIYQTEKRNYAPPDVLAGDMGLKPRTGPANRAISALRQYGLLEERDGQYRVSDTANTILFSPDDSQERGAALAEAAQKPAILKEILQTYPDGLPSDANLKSWLITRRSFNPASVDGFIKSLKETISLAKLVPGTYDGGDQTREEVQRVSPSQAETGLRQDERPGQIPSVQVFNWLLSLPRNVRAELRIYGKDLRREDLDRIRKQIDFLEEAFQEETAPPDNEEA